MHMKVPQPIQLWFNKFNTRKMVSLDRNTGPPEAGELSNFLLTKRSNPLLLIGLNNLIMETVSSYPPPDGAPEVMIKLCNQFSMFYRQPIEEPMRMIRQPLDSSNRMYMLACLLHQVRENVTHISTRVHSPLCRLAVLLDPRKVSDQQLWHLSTLDTLTDMPAVQFQSDCSSETRPIQIGVSNQVQKIGTALFSQVEGMSISFNSDSSEGDIHKTNPQIERHSVTKSSKSLRKFRRRTSAMLHNLKPKSLHRDAHFSECPRIQHITQSFLLELSLCLQWTISMRLTRESEVALEALEARANLELWTNSLLVINAVQNLCNVPVSSTEPSVNRHTYGSFASNTFGSTDPRRSSSMDTELNAQQLSLVGAYCGLWSGLIDKGGTTDNVLSVGSSVPVDQSSELVRLARKKFMRSIVTNANFHSTKPPDDITVSSDGNRTVVSAKPLVAAREECRSRVSDRWNEVTGNSTAEISGPAPSWCTPREWLKKVIGQRRRQSSN
ncbi:hypothetical protein EG68_07766 [Paragonimus skrjabini miyazakii]|uniref:Uncharacterized protein n=1 Tax=Paragonimus skrjabini miyazakii TaxID=59628 RepID=A0A8S9YLD8_9TREM|nr:hypothetical protein EG68_07766 [Paragonimus skrjabini miyazakii]